MKLFALQDGTVLVRHWFRWYRAMPNGGINKFNFKKDVK